MLNRELLEEQATNLLLITKLIERLAIELEDTTVEADRRLGCRESIGFLADLLEDHLLFAAERNLGWPRDELAGVVAVKMATLVQDRHWLIDDCHIALPDEASAPLVMGGDAWQPC